MDGGKRVRRGGGGASLALVGTAGPTGPPGRAFTCSFDPATGTAQGHMAAGDYPTISADANGLRLRPAGGKNHCNGTPLADVRRIAVTTEPGAQSKLWVELSAVDPTGAIA